MFPQMKSRSTFVRQAANLWQYKQKLQQLLARSLGALSDNTHMIDGIPILLCCFSRAPGCRSFQGEASYGYCAAKKETYYGFHGHLLISACGVITGFTLTPANGDEREAIWDKYLDANNYTPAFGSCRSIYRFHRGDVKGWRVIISVFLLIVRLIQGMVIGDKGYIACYCAPGTSTLWH